MPDPLFILAPHRSFTSIVCTMLGQHPQMYGLPEMNLFLTESMEEWWSRFHQARHYEAHGALRAVAQICFGQQTVETIGLARGWLRRRLRWDTGSVFLELADRVHPLILVDKSPNTVLRPEFLQRMRRTFPDARFLHLLRHPRAQCESMLSLLRDAGVNRARLEARIAAGGDPQQWWYANHRRVCAFLAPLPRAQKLRLRGEEVFADPDTYLRRIGAWLGVRTDPEALEQMKHPERSSFARFGPPNARLGNDPHFLEQPVLRASQKRHQSLEGPLSWRPDGIGFSPRVKGLARAFGYD
jgi:hypothetical protein